MKRNYVIILNSDSNNVLQIVNQFCDELKQEELELSAVVLTLFFLGDAVNVFFDVEKSTLEITALIENSHQFYPFSIDMLVCKTAISRRQNTHITSSNLPQGVVESSLAQLADLCLRSTHWSFYHQSHKQNYGSSHIEKVVFVLSSLPHKKNTGSHELDDRAFTDFIDLVMTFASFDMNVSLLCCGNSTSLWLKEIDENFMDDYSIEGSQIFQSWRKQCTSLIDIYEVDDIRLMHSNTVSLDFSCQQKIDSFEQTFMPTIAGHIYDDNTFYQYINNSKQAVSYWPATTVDTAEI